MPGRPSYAPQRAADPQRSHRISGYWNQPTGWFRSGTTIDGTTYHDPPQPITHGMPNNQVQRDLYHLPDPEEGSKPPAAWDEWEKNANWPFPVNMPKQASKKAAPKSSSKKPHVNSALQEELERNANWPFPARKRTQSQSAQTVPRPRTLSNSRPSESNAKSTLPAPTSAPKKPVQPVMPSYASAIPRCDPSSTTINPLLAKNSVGLVRFDLRLPYTSVRKLVRGPYWTHLNHEDLKQPASTPPRTRMRIYTHATPDWIADVRPKSREYVTVEDVLMAICGTFNVPVDSLQWARDSVNPKLADRAGRAYKRRVEKLERSRTVGYERVRKAGLLRVDYLGSEYVFSGMILCYGGNGSEWWMMEVVREER